MERRLLLSTYVVTSPADGTEGNTLRWAILQVNADTQPDTIRFDIPGSGVQSIQLSAPLPTIVNPVVIDGTTQPSYQSSPLIQLDGSQLGADSNGLVISAGNSTVQGLAIVGFSGSAIVLNSLGGNVVAADYLGVLASGTQAGSNGTGISITGCSSNTIGGSSAGSANVISGNIGNGIVIESGNGPSANNDIFGNLIGTTSTGSGALANGQCGIAIEGASGTQIGFPAVGSGNTIAGNVGPGIELSSGATGTVIQNNSIGVAADGKTLVGNKSDGILLDDAPQSQVGGTDRYEGNVIGGNLGNGINTSGDTTGLLVEGNFIGTDPTAMLNLGNRDNGVNLGSSANTIGGTSAGAGNTIDFNGTGYAGSGVQLVGDVDQDEILSNSIYGNAGLGINLGNGPTANHAAGTPGPNDYQNYPTLVLVQSDGSSTSIQGTLLSIPNTAFLLQFFANPTQDPSGFGQGKKLIDSFGVQTDEDGNVTFTVPIAAGTAAGQYISATATDPAGNTSEFSLDVAAQGEVDLILSVEATPSPVLAGDELTYAVTVTNQGDIPAQGVLLTDQLPASVSMVSQALTQGGFLSPNGTNPLTADLGTIPVGSSATLTVVVQTSAQSVGTITDSASVSSEDTDGNFGDLAATVNTTVLAAADLSVALTASANPVLLGSDLTYTMDVSNLGPDAASDATATLPLGSGLTFVSASSSTGTVTYTGGQVVADLGDLAMSGQASVQVVVQVETVGNLSETATVSSDIPDPDLSNNSATVTTEADPSADLGVTIAASPIPVAANHDFAYTVAVTNAGPSSGSNVVVTDSLPLGVTFVSASSDQGVTPTFSNGVVTLTIPTLNPNATANLTVEVDPTVSAGSTLTDTASVAGQEADPNPANNTATLMTPVEGASDLAVTAAAQPAAVYVGQNLTYTLNVSNNGPDNEPDAVLTCPLPPDVALVSAGSSQGQAPSLADGLMTADLGALAAGQTARATLVVIPQAAAAGTLTTSFSVAGENLDPMPSNNSARASVEVTPAADLAVTISPGAAAPCNQEDWTFTVTVSDLGLSNATGVTAAAPLPPNVQLISATSSQGPAPTVQAGMVSAALGAIAAGSSATVTLVVMPEAVGSMPLAASATANEFDPNLANNQTSVSVSVSPSANLAVSLVPQDQTVLTGQSFTFTVTVDNTGPNPATNVVLSLPLSTDVVFDSSTSSQGTTGLNAGQVVAQLGSLNPGSNATVVVVVTAAAQGTITQSATATAAENQLDSADETATAMATVLESAGILQFGSADVAVPETAGIARFLVVRTDGSQGAVTVNYQTIAVNATPGLDFTPTSGTLSFASGQTTGTILVPVLADPWDDHDECVDVVLGSPRGGANLGPLTTALLTIIDVDPDVTPLQVSQLSWTGTSRSITSVSMSFTAPLDPSFALNPADYQLVALGAGNRAVPFTPSTYNALTHTVTLVPAAPLSSGQYYEIQVVGSGPAAIRDVAGNLLAGAANGLAGSNYVASFAQGTRLKYVDNAGNQVTLKLSGAGYMEQIRDSSGEGVLLDLIGAVPHGSTLSGTVRSTSSHASAKSVQTSGKTDLGTIQGLGSFGAVKVLLTSPPFYVNQYPFQKHGRGVL